MLHFLKSVAKVQFLEEYSEINIGKGACVELYFSFGNWYVVSSDGIKMEELH